MFELLWLLLPVAAASGWWVAKRTERRSSDDRQCNFSGDYIKGLNFLLNEQPDKALEVFIHMVDVDSETVEAHLILGNLFRRRGEVDRAIRIHQNLIARPHLDANEKASALLELGRDYMKAGLLDRAEGLFRELRGSGGQAAEVNIHLRDLYEQEKEWERAIEAATELQQTSDQPQFRIIAHYYCEQAEEALRRGETAKAAHLAKRALGHDRGCVRASILLGDLSQGAGDYKDAIKNYRRILQQDPEFIAVVLPKLKAVFSRFQGIAAYRRILEELHQAGPSTTSVLALIDALREEGREQEAKKIMDEELVRERVSPVLLECFLRLEAEGAPPGARVVLERVAEIFSSNAADWLIYRCTQCGFEARNLLWQCPSCHAWGRMRPVDRTIERGALDGGPMTVI